MFNTHWWRLSLASLILGSVLYLAGWLTGQPAVSVAGLLVFWPPFALDLYVRSRERQELRDTAPVVIVTDGHEAIPLRHPAGIEFGVQDDNGQTLLGIQVRRTDERTLLVVIPKMPERPQGNQPDQDTLTAETKAFRRTRDRNRWLPQHRHAHA